MDFTLNHSIYVSRQLGIVRIIELYQSGESIISNSLLRRTIPVEVDMDDKWIYSYYPPNGQYSDERRKWWYTGQFGPVQGPNMLLASQQDFAALLTLVLLLEDDYSDIEHYRKIYQLQYIQNNIRLGMYDIDSLTQGWRENYTRQMEEYTRDLIEESQQEGDFSEQPNYARLLEQMLLFLESNKNFYLPTVRSMYGGNFEQFAYQDPPERHIRQLEGEEDRDEQHRKRQRTEEELEGITGGKRGRFGEDVEEFLGKRRRF